jgi:hypothetical protein
VDVSATFVVDVFDNGGPHVHGAVFDHDRDQVNVNVDVDVQSDQGSLALN